MASLLSLPNEVLEQICQRFCPHCHLVLHPSTAFRQIHRDFNANVTPKGDLRSLALTNRRLRALAEPLLYHAMCLPKASALRLLRTLSEQPQLQTHIKAVSLVWNTEGTQFEHDSGDSEPRLVNSLIKQRSDSIGREWALPVQPQYTHWGKSSPWIIREGYCSQGIVVALLLSMLPSLRYLRLQFDAAVLPPLEPGSLPELLVFSSWTYGEVTVRKVLQAAPQVETLVYYGWFPKSQVRGEAVREVRLVGQHDSWEDLGLLVASCPRTTSFSGQYAGDLFRFRGVNVVPSDIIPLLLPWKDTLTELRLGFDYFERDHPPNGCIVNDQWKGATTIGCLKQFKALKTLQIDAGLVAALDQAAKTWQKDATAQMRQDVLVDLLPASIEYFLLQPPGTTSFSEALRLLAAQRDTLFPLLKDVCTWNLEDEGEAMVSRAFSKVGTRFLGEPGDDSQTSYICPYSKDPFARMDSVEFSCEERYREKAEHWHLEF